MSKKDYIAIAAAISAASEEMYKVSRHNPVFGDGASTAIGTVIRHLSDALKADNSNFDRERFLNAAQGRFELQGISK